MASQLVLGAALGGAGAIIGYNSARSAGKKAREAGKRIAKEILADAAEEEVLRRLQGRRLEGVQRQRVAGAGVRVDTGSPLDVFAETAFTTEFAVRRIQRTAERLAQRALSEGKAVQKAYRDQAIGNILGTAGGVGMSIAALHDRETEAEKKGGGGYSATVPSVGYGNIA
jgi:hypothetical protein